MKIKSFILSGALLLAAGVATTSCEDMFTVDNHLVTTDFAPQDTVYQVMGIVQRMQKLADRTVLLGEVRADLVSVDAAHAPAAIQELGQNAVSEGNIYNKPADYYDVINACNIYLAHVDSLRGYLPTQNYYDREILAVKCFKAWCYLELVKIYGSVPYVDEPVLTADAAEAIVASGQKADMTTVLSACIKELTDFMNGGHNRWSYNEALRPAYGKKWENISYSNFFIPVRVMLGELYLWRGSCTGNRSDYLEAIRMYHDYFCFPGEERGVGEYNAYWYDRNFTNNVSSLYDMRFRLSRTSENVAVLPCDTISYYGNVNNLRAVFNSQYSNNYYPAVVPSQRLKTLSKSQQYCSYNILSGGDVTYTADHNTNDYSDPLEEGDLRLSTIYRTTPRSLENQTTGSSSSSTSSVCLKWTNGSSRLTTDVRGLYIPLYRVPILYLHMAEALNRAGFPATAYLVLAKGLDFYTIQELLAIYPHEFEGLCDIKTSEFSLSESYYRTYYSEEEGESLYGLTQNSFVIWPYEVFRHLYKVIRDDAGTRRWVYMPYPLITSSMEVNSYIEQQGIHSLGCGDTDYNQYYQLEDSETLKELEKWPLEILEKPQWGGVRNDPDSTIYNAAMEEYNAQVQKNEENQAARLAYLTSGEVKARMQARVSKLILDEEALEGMFEGTRFYDIMRYQLQETGSASTITLPAYIKDTYGTEGWTDNMTGKPWFLTLPSR